MAGMGLIVRDDPPKVVDLTVREWGAAANGFVLSIRQTPNADPDAQEAISVVLRNVGDSARELTVPGGLFFYRLEIAAADGAPVSPSPFGRELLKPERNTERVELRLGPGAVTETQIPVGSIFSLRKKGTYRVRASCALPDGTVLQSNEIVV